MMRHWKLSATLLGTLLLLGCVDPKAPPSAGGSVKTSAPSAIPTNTDAPAPASDYKKPPRMTGRGKVSSISLEDFFALQQSDAALVIDARPGLFYRLGHIPGALHLSARSTDAEIAAQEAVLRQATASGKTIVVYCSGFGCPDARTIAFRLSGFGLPASVFHGGWDAWTNAGLPTS